MYIIIKTMETPEEIEGKSLVHWQKRGERLYDDFTRELIGDDDIRKCRFFSQNIQKILIMMDGKKVVGFISRSRDETIQV